MGRAPLISALYQEDFAESVPMNCIRRTNTRAERRIGMSGQSVVEIAFSLPFLLVIVLMVIEMGIVFSTYLAVVNAAREGAVFASMYPKLVDATCGSTPQPDCVGASDSLPMNGITGTQAIWREYSDRVTNEAYVAVGERLQAQQLIRTGIFRIERPIESGANVGDSITVTVHYTITSLSSGMSFPIFGRMGLPNSYHIHYDFAMPIR